jgi:hypothetical protein
MSSSPIVFRWNVFATITHGIGETKFMSTKLYPDAKPIKIRKTASIKKKRQHSQKTDVCTMTYALFFTAKTEYPLHVHFYYSPRPTLYASQHCSLRVSPCTLYNQQPALYTIIFNLHTPHSTLHNLHLTLHSLRFTLHTVHSPIAAPRQLHAWFSPRAWHTKNNIVHLPTPVPNTRPLKARDCNVQDCQVFV